MRFVKLNDNHFTYTGEKLDIHLPHCTQLDISNNNLVVVFN